MDKDKSKISVVDVSDQRGGDTKGITERIVRACIEYIQLTTDVPNGVQLGKADAEELAAARGGTLPKSCEISVEKTGTGEILELKLNIVEVRSITDIRPFRLDNKEMRELLKEEPAQQLFGDVYQRLGRDLMRQCQSSPVTPTHVDLNPSDRKELAEEGLVVGTLLMIGVAAGEEQPMNLDLTICDVAEDAPLRIHMGEPADG